MLFGEVTELTRFQLLLAGVRFGQSGQQTATSEIALERVARNLEEREISCQLNCGCNEESRTASCGRAVGGRESQHGGGETGGGGGGDGLKKASSLVLVDLDELAAEVGQGGL